MSERRFTWPEGFGPEDDSSQGELLDIGEHFVGKSRRARRALLPPSKVVAAVTDACWRLVSDRTPGVLHRAIDETSTVSVCGVPMLAMTFDPGQIAAGCPDCAALSRLDPKGGDTDE